MIKNYFKIAWRSVLRNKGTAIINITGLAVGMTAAVLILLWVSNEISFDDFHPDDERIYRLTTSIPQNNMRWESAPLLMADAAKKQLPGIEKIARLYVGELPVFTTKGNKVPEKECAFVDGSWFSIFHYDFIEGNAVSFDANPYSIILTASMAKKYFGDRAAVGAILHIDSMNYQVTAIVKDAPANSSFQYQAFMPLSALLANPDIKKNDENWDNFNYITFIKLRPGVSTTATSRQLINILPGNEKAETKISLISLKDMHFETGLQNSVFVHGNRSTVYIFSILAFLLLLVACINYVNLTTAKASLRAKEVSIRKINGAKRAHIFYQFITESFLISLIAVIITLFIVQWCLPAFNSFTGRNFIVSLTSESMWQIIGITMGTAMLLNSIYPALLLSSFKPLNVFRGITLLKVKDNSFRKVLVVLQFTISVILITATIVIYYQMRFVQHSDPGYNRSQVLSFAVNINAGAGKKALLIQTLKQELLAQNSIQSVTVANQPIVNMGSYSTGSADWEGHDTTFNPKIAQLSADADFQRTMLLKMKEGRWFQQGEFDKNNVVLNETAVTELNIHAPVLGQRFSFKGRTGQIIGVVKNFNYKSTHEKMGPLVAFNDPSWYRVFMVRVAPGSAAKAVSAIGSVYKKILPDDVFEYNFLEDSFNQMYKEDQQTSSLIIIFAIIAVAVSSLGLFALTAFTAEQRKKEIGIRKVLGATVTSITTLLSNGLVKLVGMAILIATPLAFWATSKWIQGFAYRINISWWMFAVAGVFTLLIALITTGAHSIKAALVNPVKSLKSE